MMPGFDVTEQNTQQNIDSQPDTVDSKLQLSVDTLDGRVCYFSLSGNLALQAFEDIQLSTFSQQKKKAKLKQALTSRLYFAMLMFDKVVMHCSDPLRSDIVLDFLEKHIQWIETGRIVFIVSNHISTIENDYENYIRQKIQEYSEGYRSVKEAESLNQAYMTPEYYSRVKKVINASPYFIRKPTDENYSFSKLVLSDLGHQFQNEQVIIGDTLDIPQILSLSLSLYQLLHAKVLSEDNNNQIKPVFPEVVVNQVSKQIQLHLQQSNSIARSAIVDSIKDELETGLSDIQEKLLAAISLRMDVLYCHMNSGKQLILEFHPSYEQRSIYQENCFAEYLKAIAQTDRKITLRKSIIDQLLGMPDLYFFRSLYLSSMADAKEYMNLAQAELQVRYQENILIAFNNFVKKYEPILSSSHLLSARRILNGEKQ